MANTVKIFVALSIFILLSAVIMGCSDNSGSSGSDTAAAVAATTAGPLYTAGDIVKNPKSTGTTALLIVSYDSASDSYERAIIYPKDDGTWGYRMDGSTQKLSRAALEKVYTDVIDHVSVSSVPTSEPTTLTTATTVATVATTSTTVTATTTAAVVPSIRDMDPDEAYAGKTISTEITGDNFVSGATALLHKDGEDNITATSVSYSSDTEITAKFTIPAETTVGSWDIVVINPSGKQGTYTNFFTIHNSSSSS